MNEAKLPSGGWRMAARIAWPEPRPSAGKVLFVIVALLLPVFEMSTSMS